MPSSPKLKKRAAEFEQKKQFDKALELYVQILQDSGRDLGDDDVPLYNRVGDLLMRQGRVSEALSYYENAVDVYAERGYLNNAIALCSKILRQSPGRTAVYYKLGKISASKGFKSDARKNFLEYAERMQKSGHLDEAFRALKEFAALYPDQDDIRLILAEQLSKENRKGEALEQLQELHSKLEREGRDAEARATIDRMKAIDPEVVPRKTAPRGVERQNDLIFLDLSDTEAPPRPAVPTPALTPRRITTSQPQIPALEGLKVTFVPDTETEATLPEPVAHIEGFEANSPDAVPGEEIPGEGSVPEESSNAFAGRDRGSTVAQADLGLEDDLHPVSARERDVEIEPVAGLELIEEESTASGADEVAPDEAAPPATVTPAAAPPVVEPGVVGEYEHVVGAESLAADAEGEDGIGVVADADHVADLAPAAVDARERGPAAPSEGHDDARAAREEMEAALIDAGLKPRHFDELPYDVGGEVGETPSGGTEPAPEASEAGAVAGLEQAVIGEIAASPDEAAAAAQPAEAAAAEDGGSHETVTEGAPSSESWVTEVAPTADGPEEPSVHAAQEASGELAAVGAPDALPDQTEQREGTGLDAPGESRQAADGATDQLDAAREGAERENRWRLEAPPSAVAREGESGRGNEVIADDAIPADLTIGYGAPRSDPEADDDFSELLNAPPSFGEGGFDTAPLFTPIPGFSFEAAGVDAEPGDAGEDSGDGPDEAIEADEVEHVGEGDAREAPVTEAAAHDESKTGEGERVQFRTPRPTVSLGGAEDHLRRRLELDPENWALRRQLGEALLDSGNRDGGLYELELAMVGFELARELDRAQQVADEIIRVLPTSVRHHQKRVEYAVRAKDRPRLVEAYLELADALFRTGEAEKSVSVYARVLELAPRSERAVFALATLAPDVLAQMRGAPARSERWSDELEAIADSGAPLVHLAEESELGEPYRGTPTDVAAVDPDVTSRERLTPSAAADASPASDAATISETVDDDAAVPASAGEVSGEATSPEPARDGIATPDVPVDAVGLEPAHELGEVASQGAAVNGEDASAVDAGAVDASAVDASAAEASGGGGSAEETRGDAANGAEVNGEAANRAEVNGERRPRPDTPILNRARALTPANGNGPSRPDFVDLGAWLRHAEPERSTRMVMAGARPTGDEQADFEDMLRRFKRGIAENVDEEDFDAHYDLGVAYKEMGLTDEAISEFQKALRGTEQRVRAYEALGQCFVEKEQYPIAAALLQRAVEMPSIDDQRLVGVLYLLGWASEQTGRHADALRYYQRVFAVDIQFRDIGTRISAMEQSAK